MTTETQALLSAIETLCGKKKAKLLRRLAKAAVEAERAQATYPWTITTDGSGVATTQIDTATAMDGNVRLAGVTLT